MLPLHPLFLVQTRRMDFEDVMAAQIIGYPFDIAVCDVECKSLVVDTQDEPFYGAKEEPYTASCSALVKTEPTLEPTLPPPPPSSPAPAAPSTPQAGVTTRSRTQSAASTLVTTAIVPSTKPRLDKTKAKARPTAQVTKKKGAVRWGRPPLLNKERKKPKENFDSKKKYASMRRDLKG
jgi:hypothetical protein